jgi:hypothetical protein
MIYVAPLRSGSREAFVVLIQSPRRGRRGSRGERLNSGDATAWSRWPSAQLPGSASPATINLPSASFADFA